jgi:DHA1 family tetracycline resistance protein-like MFS transporter
MLVGGFFLATFAFACFETTLPLLVERSLHLDVKGRDRAVVGYLFAYAGLIGALVQGGAIGMMVKRFGEPKLIVFSTVVLGVSLMFMPFLHNWPVLLAGLAGLSIGSSLTRPPLFGLISMMTPLHEQGATLGVAQGAGSLARIVGPIFAATLFEYRPALPYLICGAMALVAGFWAWQTLCRGELPISGKAPVTR